MHPRFLPASLSAVVLAAVLPLHAQPATATATNAAATGAVPLIERAKFFGNPSKAGGRLSPDGRWLSWVAPRDGVLNLWVAPLNEPAAARALTNERGRPIRNSFWSPDSKTLLYVNDQGGDENFRLYGVDVASGALKSYTPFEKTVVRVIGISPKVKDRVLIGLNNRDPRFHDVHSLDLASGKLTLVLQNEGYGSFNADRDLNLRLASRPNAAGGSDYFRISDTRSSPRPSSAWAWKTARPPRRWATPPTARRCTGWMRAAATPPRCWRRMWLAARPRWWRKTAAPTSATASSTRRPAGYRVTR